jgi:hypothetical protein
MDPDPRIRKPELMDPDSWIRNIYLTDLNPGGNLIMDPDPISHICGYKRLV